MGTAMVFLKYLAALLLGLAALEATWHFLALSGTVHLAVAGVLYAYGIATLLILKPTIAARVYDALGFKEPTLTDDVLAKVKLIAHGAYLTLFRVAFVIAALAYLAQALSLADASFLRGHENLGYPSFLLAVFETTFPPIGALIQYVFPDLQAAIFNESNTSVLVFKGIVYVSFATIAVAIVKDVWSLAYHARYDALREAVLTNVQFSKPLPLPEETAEELNLEMKEVLARWRRNSIHKSENNSDEK
jgi:hypothetical protein